MIRRVRVRAKSYIIANRYDKGQAIILTSNKAFSEWGDFFRSNAVMASAALDRLLHRSTVISVRGESYRLMEKRQAGRPPNNQKESHHEYFLTSPTAEGGAVLMAAKGSILSDR